MLCDGLPSAAATAAAVCADDDASVKVFVQPADVPAKAVAPSSPPSAVLLRSTAGGWPSARHPPPHVVAHLFLAAATSLQIASLINAGICYVTKRASDKCVVATFRSVKRVEKLLLRGVDGGFSRFARLHASLSRSVRGSCNIARSATTAFGSAFRLAGDVAHGVTEGGLKMILHGLRHFEAATAFALPGTRLDPTTAETKLSAWSALQTFATIFAPLIAASPVAIVRAAMALGQLQEETHTPYPPVDSPVLDLSLPTAREQMDELCYRYKQSLAAYDRRILQLSGNASGDSLRELFGVDSEAILLREENSRMHRPAHFLILDHSSRSICLVIRGTVEASDFFTDFCCAPDEEWQSHSGMAAAARCIDAATRSTIVRMADLHPTYRIITEGHSLGGGVATLLAWLWKDDPRLAGVDGRRLRCYSFAAPFVVPPRMGRLMAPYATSIVYARDLVSRACPAATFNAHRMLMHLAGRSCKQEESDAASVESDSEFFEAVESEIELRRSTPVKGTPRGELSKHGRLYEHLALTDESLLASASTVDWDEVGKASADDVRSAAVLKAVARCRDGSDHSARAQVREQLTALRALTSDDGLLGPGGRVLLLVPAEDMVAAGRSLPEFLSPGGCVAFELTMEDLIALLKEPLFHPAAVADHFPHRLGRALGLFIPNEDG